MIDNLTAINRLADGNLMTLFPPVAHYCHECGGSGKVRTNFEGFLNYAQTLFDLGYPLREVWRKWHYFSIVTWSELTQTGKVNCKFCNYGY